MTLTQDQQDQTMFLPIVNVSSNPEAEVINSNFHSPLEGSRDSLSGTESPDQISACGRFVRPDREDAREETLSKFGIVHLSLYFLFSLLNFDLQDNDVLSFSWIQYKSL